ncbi:MAG: AsmA family protein [Proteobacteria bacterium]|nr:AsmA family protein [Pseudomonadota bacterium]
MKVIKWFVVGVLALLVIAVVAAATGAFYVQHNDLRGLVAWAAKKEGVPLELGGPVRVQLWPTLTVKVQDVKVGALQGEGTLFAVDAAALQMGWGSGLAPWKNMRVIAVEAKNPTVTLRKDKNGVANWSLPGEPAKAEDKSAPVAEVGGCRIGEECRELPMLVATRLAVGNLNLTYDDAVSGQHAGVKNMDLTANTSGTVAQTTLQGTVNGQAINGTMKVDVHDLQNIPVNAKLDAAGLHVAVDGRVVEQKEFAGLVSAQTDNLKGTVEGLLGKAPPQTPAEAFKLVGDMTIGAERVVLRNFNTTVGSLLNATGKVNVALGDKPSADGQVKVSGANLRALAELGSGQAQPNLPALPFELATNLSGKDAIVLQNMNFSLSSLATVAGDVRVVPPAATGGQPDVDAQLGLKVASVKHLGQAMQLAATLPDEALSARVTVKGSGGAYSVPSLEAQLGDLAKASGNLDITPGDKLKVDGALTVTGADVKAAAKAFGVDAAAVPASPFKVSAKVAGQGTLTLSDLVVDLPQIVQASGKLAVTPGKPTNIDGGITVTRLNGDALGYCKAAAPADATPPVSAASSAPGSADTPWSDAPINLAMLGDYAGDVTVAVSGISCESFPAQNVALHVQNTPSQLDIKDMKVGLPGDGALTANATLEHAGTPKLMLTLQGNDVQLEELVPSLKSKGVSLQLQAKTMLNSVGGSTRALAKNLGGSLEITSDKGRLPYGNLLGNLGNIQNLLKGQAAVASNGSGSVDKLEARYSIKQGVATTEAFDLSTGGGQMKLKGTGTIDIGNWVIDYTLTPTVTVGTDLSVPVVVKGPLGGPSIGADPAYLQRLTSRLASEGVQGLLGVGKDASKGIGAAVGDVLTGKGLSGEGVGGLINGLVGGNKATSGSEAVSDTSSNSKGKVKPKDVLKAFGFGQ